MDAFKKHAATLKQASLKSLASKQETWQWSVGECVIDLSKHYFIQETLDYWIAYAQRMGVPEKLTTFFSDNASTTPSYHWLFRHPDLKTFSVNGTNVIPAINHAFQAACEISERIRQQTFFANQPMKAIVHLGIGGSQLGCKMALSALAEQVDCDIPIHFVSTVDEFELDNLLRTLTPDNTLLIVTSKSFSTAETLSNTQTVAQWLGPSRLSTHIIAVTDNEDAANAFGIPKKHCLPHFSWVTGRFSLWSCVGLPLLIKLGIPAFQALLSGAFDVDQHVQQTPLAENIPFRMACLSLWYTTFLNANSQGIISYSPRLAYFADYCQQLTMESLGKTSEHLVASPIVWGACGTDAQHSFFQCLHQGPHRIPLDIICPFGKPTSEKTAQRLANALAQIRALAFGSEANTRATEKVNGNTPVTAIYLQSLSPRALGNLCALYENKTVIQSFLAGINAFDQSGVEYGKQVANHLLPSVNEALSREDMNSLVRQAQSADN